MFIKILIITLCLLALAAVALGVKYYKQKRSPYYKKKQSKFFKHTESGNDKNEI